MISDTEITSLKLEPVAGYSVLEATYCSSVLK